MPSMDIKISLLVIGALLGVAVVYLAFECWAWASQAGQPIGGRLAVASGALFALVAAYIVWNDWRQRRTAR